MIGIVLAPPSDEHIKVAWNCDLGSPRDEVKLREYVRRHFGKLRHPLTLLTNTPKVDGINELIIQGDEDTSIGAVFYKFSDPWSTSRARTLADAIEENSGKNVPLLKLPKPTRLSNPDYPILQGQLNSLISEFLAA